MEILSKVAADDVKLGVGQKKEDSVKIVTVTDGVDPDDKPIKIKAGVRMLSKTQIIAGKAKAQADLDKWIAYEKQLA